MSSAILIDILNTIDWCIDLCIVLYHDVVLNK